MTELVLALVGLAAGMIAAGVGVGGGIIFVPALVIIAGFGQHLAEGTSLAVILPTMVVAAWTHGRAGRVEWATAARIGIVGVAGGLAGAWLALAIDEDLLQRLFAIVLVIVAVRMVRRTQRAAHEADDEV